MADDLKLEFEVLVDLGVDRVLEQAAIAERILAESAQRSVTASNKEFARLGTEQLQAFVKRASTAYTEIATQSAGATNRMRQTTLKDLQAVLAGVTEVSRQSLSVLKAQTAEESRLRQVAANEALAEKRKTDAISKALDLEAIKTNGAARRAATAADSAERRAQAVEDAKTVGQQDRIANSERVRLSKEFADEERRVAAQLRQDKIREANETAAAIAAANRKTAAEFRVNSLIELQEQRSGDNLELAEVKGHQNRMTEVWKRGWQLITNEQKNFITKHRENQRNADVLEHIEEQRKATESIETAKSSLRQQEELQRSTLSRQNATARAQTIAGSGVTGAVTGRSGIGIGLRNLAFIGGGIFGVRSTLQIGQDFAQTIAVVGAAANLTADQLEKVRKKSIELGNDIALPGVSAKEGAEAIGLMAQSGIDLTITLDGAARAALTLARAAGVEVKDAVQIVDDAINVFRLSGKDAQRTVDDLAGSIKIAGGETIPELAQAFQSASAVFQSTFQNAADGATNFRELNAAIDLLGKNGVRGETAGTAIRNALVRLTSPSKPAEAALAAVAKQAGITGGVLFDVSGKTRTFSSVVDILAKGFKGFATEEERSAAFVDIFGAKSQIAARLLTEQSDVFKQNIAILLAGETVYTKTGLAIQKQGAAAKLAAAQNSGLKGAIDALVSQFQTFQIELFLLVNNPGRKVILGIATAIDQLANADRFHTIRVGLEGVAIAGAALLVLKTAAEGVQLLSVSLQLLAASPVALIATAILGLAFAIGFFSAQNTDFGKALHKLLDDLKALGGQFLKDVVHGDFAKARDDLFAIFKEIRDFPLAETLGFLFKPALIHDLITGQFSKAKDDLVAILRDIVSSISRLSVTQDIISSSRRIGSTIADAAAAGFHDAIDFTRVLLPKIREEALRLPGQAADLGAAIWKGIIDGFNGKQRTDGLQIAGTTGLTPEQAGAAAGLGALDDPALHRSIGDSIGRALIAGVKFALVGVETAGKLLAEGLFNKFTIEGVAAVTAGLLAAAIILGGTFLKGFAEGLDHNKGQIAEALIKIMEVAVGAALIALKKLLTGSPIWLEIATAIGLIFVGGKIFSGISQEFKGVQTNLRSGLLALNGDFKGSRQVVSDYKASLREVRVGEADAFGAAVPGIARSINQGFVVPFQKAKTTVLDFFATLRGEKDIAPVQGLNQAQTSQIPKIAPNSFLAFPQLGPVVDPAEATRVAALTNEINKPTGFTTGMQAAGAAAAIASVGLASFFAFSSKDNTTKLISASTAIAGVVTAYALGGPIAAGFAGAAAGVGAILGINAKAAKEAADRTKEWLDILKAGDADLQRQKAIDDFSQKLLDGDKNATAFAKNLGGNFSELTDAIFAGSSAVQAFKDKLLDKTLADALNGQGTEAKFVADRLATLTREGVSYGDAVKRIRTELETKPGFDFIDEQAKAYKDAADRQNILKNAIGNSKDKQLALTQLAQLDAKSRGEALNAQRDLFDLLARNQAGVVGLALGLDKFAKDAKAIAAAPADEQPRLRLELEQTARSLSGEFVQGAKDAIAAANAIGGDPVQAVEDYKNALRDKLTNPKTGLGLAKEVADELLGKLNDIGGKQIKAEIDIVVNADTEAAKRKIRELGIIAPTGKDGKDLGIIIDIGGPDPVLLAQGGIVNRETFARIAEGNKPEVVIPLTDPRRAVELATQSGLLKILADGTTGAVKTATPGIKPPPPLISVDEAGAPKNPGVDGSMFGPNDHFDPGQTESRRDFATLKARIADLVAFAQTQLKILAVGGGAFGGGFASVFGFDLAQTDAAESLAFQIGHLADLADGPALDKLKTSIGTDLLNAINDAKTAAEGFGEEPSQSIEILEGRIQKGLVEKFNLSTDAASNLVAEMDKIARDIAVQVHFNATINPFLASIFDKLPAGDNGIDIGATVLGLQQGAARGKIIDHEQILRVGERGRKEVIVPLEDPDRAFALMVATGLDRLVARDGPVAATPSSTISAAPRFENIHVHEVAGDPVATGIVAGRHIAAIVQKATF